MIQVDGVELCADWWGAPAEPPVLLIMGLGASMLWWPEDFCRALADGGRFVVRYDQRDTGRSITYPLGNPGYTGGDLVSDVIGILDAYQLRAAHLVGVSAGGAIAQLVALDHPGRVLSLVLISTSPALAIRRELPPPTDAFGQFFSGPPIDWSDPQSVIDYRTRYTLMLAGSERQLDAAQVREFVRRDVERSRDFSAAGNHDQLTDDDRDRGPLAAISAPTLVIHGTADPMFPLEHGQALAEVIPNAHLVAADGAGHGLESMDQHMVVKAILEHSQCSRYHPKEDR